MSNVENSILFSQRPRRSRENSYSRQHTRDLGATAGRGGMRLPYRTCAVCAIFFILILVCHVLRVRTQVNYNTSLGVGFLSTHLERLRTINNDWGKYGGLAICPETRTFFAERARGKRTVCEIGMGTGASALMFLSSSPYAAVHEFDLGDTTKYRVSSYLRDNFAERFIPHWGDFYDEIPRNSMNCDLIYVDALHPDDVKLAMKHLGGRHADWLYHAGGGGKVKARQYLLAEYKELWEEVAVSNTSRSDGERCVYFQGHLMTQS